MYSIRQINDPILHRPPFWVNFDDPKHLAIVHSSLQIMQDNLHQTGGVGIAANQCAQIADPPQMFIVGNNILTTAQQRYPTKIIPQETIMINPKILDYADPYYPDTGEGCLSVKSSLRARVKRYRSVMIEYSDLTGHRGTHTHRDFFAHIVQHEYDHLQGIVFLQKSIQELNKTQIEQFLFAITHLSPDAAREVKSPILAIDRDAQEQACLRLDNLNIALSETNSFVLERIQIILQQKLDELEKRDIR